MVTGDEEGELTVCVCDMFQHMFTVCMCMCVVHRCGMCEAGSGSVS